MKKVFGAAMAVMIAFASVGCSASGYKTLRARLKKNAEKCFDAAEASKKQLKAIESDDFSPDDSVFKNGCYLIEDEKDIGKSTYGLKALKDGGATGSMLIIKNEDDSIVFGQSLELEDKELAQDVYDELAKSLVFDSKDLKEAKKSIKDLETGVNDDDENLYAGLVLSESKNMAKGVYIKLDDKVVTAIYFTGELKSDLYEEYLDFMFNSKLQDMEGLL